MPEAFSTPYLVALPITSQELGRGDFLPPNQKRNMDRMPFHTGCPRKNATDLKNSNANCFIFTIKRLVLLKSTIIRIVFDTFSRIFGDLVVKSQISKLQNFPCVETRAAALAMVNHNVKS